MDEELRSEAEEFLGNLPLSVEMPAGTGKTQLIAAMSKVATDAGKSVLVLTHTNAGVIALRSRIREFGVPQRSFHVDTIASWAFELVRHYPVLAGITMPPAPDWSQTKDYVIGAIKVARARAIQEMHAASFDVLLVDEYQDCNVMQHELILAISKVLPAALFGDRLQGIFDFKGEAIVDWDAHVIPGFPAVSRTHTAWRWKGYNEELGEWLLDIRRGLISGRVIDLSKVKVNGFQWLPDTHKNLMDAAFSHGNYSESVVIMNRWRDDNVKVANRLNGGYSVMEDINGRFMRTSLANLEQLEISGYALWLAKFTKACFTGYAKIDAAVLNRFSQGRNLDGLSRPEIVGTLTAISGVAVAPSIENLAKAMVVIERSGEGRLHSHEAWRDTLAALRTAALDPDLDPQTSLALIRDRLRYSGRKVRQRVVSRTLLIKGLEYDHAIVCSAHDFGSLRHLYVGFTRPRRTLTVLSKSPKLRLIG